MRTRLATVLVAALGAVLAWHAGASSAERTVGGVDLPPLPAVALDGLWASINKCDTADNPDTIGVRGSMPGLGVRRVAQMRFRVQFKRPSDGRWVDAGPAATSDWKRVGVVVSAVLQSGQDFTFEPPAGGGRHTLRGVVDFRWLRKNRVVRRATKVTEAGHPSSAGGDPADYSAATCVIR